MGDMLLAIDIGNSNITLGDWEEMLFEARGTAPPRPPTRYGVEIVDIAGSSAPG